MYESSDFPEPKDLYPAVLEVPVLLIPHNTSASNQKSLFHHHQSSVVPVALKYTNAVLAKAPVIITPPSKSVRINFLNY